VLKHPPGSPICDFEHGRRVIHAWLCITRSDSASYHQHVCGVHAPPTNEPGYVFTTISPTFKLPPPPAYSYISGLGCQRPDERSQAFNWTDFMADAMARKMTKRPALMAAWDRRHADVLLMEMNPS